MAKKPIDDDELRLALRELNRAFVRQGVCLKALSDLLVEKKILTEPELTSAIEKQARLTTAAMKSPGSVQ
jgi:hypothetical protein